MRYFDDDKNPHNRDRDSRDAAEYGMCGPNHDFGDGDGGGTENSESFGPAVDMKYIDGVVEGIDQEELNNLTEQQIIEKCVWSRIYFAEVVLGLTLEDWQFDVLLALDEGETRISIRSGNGVGKTFLLAIICLHFLLFRNDVKIPVTAPSSGQLKDGLIPECHKWLGRLPEFLRNRLVTTADRISRSDAPENNFISFRTARKETPEALQGIHARHVLAAVDEASGVPDTVYEAAAGTMSTPGAIFVLISNPTRLSGYFYNTHHRAKQKWRRFHVTSFDTSQVDQEFVDSIISDYGKQSDQYRIKVLGDFPTREEQTLISRKLVAAAFEREIIPHAEDGIMGVDVGRGGDLSALVVRRGMLIDLVATRDYSDTMQTVGWVKEYWDALQTAHTAINRRLASPLIRDLKPVSTIYVDSIGIGAGVADRLRELGLPAVDVNVAESPALKTKYVRMRDELWWTYLKWLETRTCRFDLDHLENAKTTRDWVEEESSAPLALITATGKDTVETKAQMKQRGIKSPNIADATCLTFAYSGAVGAGQYQTGQSSWKKPLTYSGVAHIW